MNEIIQTYGQQDWNKKGDVEIRKGAIVTVNGEGLTTDNEIALANIVLRLNSNKNLNEIEIESLKAQRESVKEFLRNILSTMPEEIQEEVKQIVGL